MKPYSDRYKEGIEKNIALVRRKLENGAGFTNDEHYDLVMHILRRQGVSLNEALFAFFSAIAMGDLYVSEILDSYYSQCMTDKERAMQRLSNDVPTVGLYDRAANRVNKTNPPLSLYHTAFSEEKFNSFYSNIKIPSTELPKY